MTTEELRASIEAALAPIAHSVDDLRIEVELLRAQQRSLEAAVSGLRAAYQAHGQRIGELLREREERLTPAPAVMPGGPV